MSKLNETQIEMIKSFAKNSKIGQAKATEFAESLLSTVQRKSGSGRTASPETIRIRVQADEALKGMAEQFKVADLASALGVEPIKVNALLQYMQKQGKVTVVGKAPKPKGQRGKPANLYSVVKDS